jgi:hypothetical protein
MRHKNKLWSHLRDHEVEWAVETVRVQNLGQILADLLQGSKGTLKTHMMPAVLLKKTDQLYYVHC